MESCNISRIVLLIAKARITTSNVMCLPYFPHRNIKSPYFNMMKEMSYKDKKKDLLLLYDYYIFLNYIELEYNI